MQIIRIMWVAAAHSVGRPVGQSLITSQQVNKIDSMIVSRRVDLVLRTKSCLRSIILTHRLSFLVSSSGAARIRDSDPGVAVSRLSALCLCRDMEIGMRRRRRWWQRRRRRRRRRLHLSAVSVGSYHRRLHLSRICLAFVSHLSLICLALV